MDVENFGVRLVGQQLVAHGMHQMGLAQADAAVDEQRVVQMPGRAGDMHRGRSGHAVGRTFDQGVERQGRIQTGAEHRRRRLFLGRAGGDLLGFLYARTVG
ncbi:hypothetical protein D3C78_1186000 [compost metagenome]